MKIYASTMPYIYTAIFTAIMLIIFFCGDAYYTRKKRVAAAAMQ